MTNVYWSYCLILNCGILYNKIEIVRASLEFSSLVTSGRGFVVEWVTSLIEDHRKEQVDWIFFQGETRRRQISLRPGAQQPLQQQKTRLRQTQEGPVSKTFVSTHLTERSILSLPWVKIINQDQLPCPSHLMLLLLRPWLTLDRQQVTYVPIWLVYQLNSSLDGGETKLNPRLWKQKLELWKDWTLGCFLLNKKHWGAVLRLQHCGSAYAMSLCP